MIISNKLWHKKQVGHTAAGTDVSEVLTETAIDVGATDCYDRARLIFELGTVTSGGVLKAEVVCASSASGSFVASGDLGENGWVATGKSESTVILDVPVTGRYLKVGYQRTTANIELDAVVLELYSGFKEPVAQDTGVAKMVYVG